MREKRNYLDVGEEGGDSTKEVGQVIGGIVMRAELEINRPVGVRQSGANIPDLETEGGRGSLPITLLFVVEEREGRQRREERERVRDGRVGAGTGARGAARWFTGRKEGGQREREVARWRAERKRGRSHADRLLIVVSPVSSGSLVARGGSPIGKSEGKEREFIGERELW
ncbi:hypothetical protein ACJRO7_029325 [Eucalyptus globulus]|uniref:Uncharacterized protein n=1 Tax=Eucalyptus globulus TaxID=34317 RepID=A0ABD3K1E6_EUCGL